MLGTLLRNMPMRPIEDDTTEHLPSCGVRYGKCANGCEASPSWAPISAVHYRSAKARPEPTEEPATDRKPSRFANGERLAPPLWEECSPDHMKYLRSMGEVPQLPETYTAYERCYHSLDRWTSDDGEQATKLAEIILKRERTRMAKVLQTNADHRAKVVAAWVRDVFPAVATLDDYIDAHNGFVAGCYAGVVWGLALYMFGLTHDPLPEHVSGRILRGAPVRDTRAPFRDIEAVLGQRWRGLLGGGNCAWPSDNNRPRKRTVAVDGEMRVSPTFVGSTNIRGEASINRAISGDFAVSRAGLSETEQEMLRVYMSRKLTRQQKIIQIREILFTSRGGNLTTLLTDETQRLAALHEMMYTHELTIHKQRLSDAPDDDARGKLNSAFAEEMAARRQKIEDRAPEDRKAYPSLLRKATADMSDDDLFRKMKEHGATLRSQALRETKEGDALVNPAPPRRPARTRHQDPAWEPLI